MRPVVIHGAGHIGRALAGILAPVPSLAIMLAESRPSLLCDLSARITPCADPFAAITIAPDDAAHVVVTHDHALDLELCHRLLLRSFGSVGLIGSASKWARFQQRLAALGHSDAQISRISCPIGDPRLGKHPQAIALGVAAALLKEPDTKAQDRRRTA
ncbi:XdhC family protein [Roseovarius sp. BRH_c41]|uniref:XdhC family protein n=1 Tax=Roseovarius sp. BRH_c41 TaxID=1629709 RepID=UPI0025D8529A|nr:XdhC family protein [Roseovarius sp. BRH_c41]